jgi:ABC-type oligopeptide transport system substrate-binding subunit
LEFVDWPKWAAYLQEGWEGLFYHGSGFFANFQQFLDAHFREGSNEDFSVIRPPGFQELIEEALSTREVDPAKVQKAARVLFDQVLWIPVFHHGQCYAYTANVHNLNYGDYNMWCNCDSEYIWLSQ